MKKEVNKILIKFLSLVLFILIIIFVVYYWDLSRYLHSEILQENIKSYGLWAPFIFILTFILFAVTFIPPLPLDLAAGVLFGKFWGVIYVVLGATVGAYLAFTIARALGRPFVDFVLKDRFKNIYKYNKQLKKNGFKVMLFFRLIPLFPYIGLNFALALTKVKTKDFVLSTFIGALPGAIAYVYLGESMARVSWLNILISLTMLGLLSALLPLSKKLRLKKIFKIE